MIPPGPSQPEGATPPAPNTQRKRPGVGTQTLVPLNLFAVVALLRQGALSSPT